MEQGMEAFESGHEELAACQQLLGYQFVDLQKLKCAFTHASGAAHRLCSNERLEFLGDSILGLVICETLYARFPEYLEGELTKIKSVVVSRQMCAKITEKIGLQQFMILGKGMTSSPTVPPSLLADVYEAIIAAIYLDGGYEPAKTFILSHLESEIEAIACGESVGNYKSVLQQFSQKEHGVTPIYFLLEEKGPDHNKCFKVSAQIGKKKYPPAWGRS